MEMYKCMSNINTSQACPHTYECKIYMKCRTHANGHTPNTKALCTETHAYMHANIHISTLAQYKAQHLTCSVSNSHPKLQILIANRPTKINTPINTYKPQTSTELKYMHAHTQTHKTLHGAYAYTKKIHTCIHAFPYHHAHISHFVPIQSCIT